MKQSLFLSFCPVCKKKVKNLIGKWITVVNPKALPDNLPKESCPSCTLDLINKKCLTILTQPRLL